MREIIIENARENNLKDVSLRIPHYQLVVVTGVSGSGKTSLVHDVISAEGKRLFFENFMGGRMTGTRISRPKVARIEGLFPVVALDQNSTVRSPRSTVGTLTELYDLLRLLFARLGRSDDRTLHLHRSLFSFNLPDGWCPACKGLGVQDHIDVSLLISDAGKTIREGAFVLTTPNNYIVYSQVTMDVLDQVCRAEGFSVDIPWNDLTLAQQRIVLYGSNKIKVLFGKHPLESRLKWTGITAKPREEDYYKGIVPVMEEILKRERNPNIMRFARSQTCDVCEGRRLNAKGLSVQLWGMTLPEFAGLTVSGLYNFFSTLKPSAHEAAVAEPVREAILKRTALLMKLGAGHLALNRESLTLSGGEAQRIRLAKTVNTGLRNVLYILDEPSAGLHPAEHGSLLEVLRMLVSGGNTVILVDHDEQSICRSDWIVDIGPGPGSMGGKVLFNGPAADFFSKPQTESLTRQCLDAPRIRPAPARSVKQPDFFYAGNARTNNLRGISPRFLLNACNVITGISGSGKSSLAEYLTEHTRLQKADGTGVFKKVVHIDASPIGRTPRSNPATYTGLSDHVRDLLASLPASRERGYKKGQFSFVVKGGRCEDCGGAGLKQIGMHFLGNVDVICDTCEGKRFSDETLEIRYNGLNISGILELSIEEAHAFFKDHKKIRAVTTILCGLGLGYLKLGQPSTTLSGGEAQRVKLAAELSKISSGHTLYVLDEPTTGLHMADVEVLLKALRTLIDKGHTLLIIENDPAFILRCDWLVDLGPGSAHEGGGIVMEGFVEQLIDHPDSHTSAELRKYLARGVAGQHDTGVACEPEVVERPLMLKGAATNNLQNVNVAFPVDKITAVTGVSGSGKSSLVFGTLYAESQHRFLEGMSAYARQFRALSGVPVLEEAIGLLPAIALQKRNPAHNPRSTIATFTGLYDLYRLMYSRLARSRGELAHLPSTAFSFNSEEGACNGCRGLGTLTVCDADQLLTHPDRSLIAGALDGTKTGSFYGEPFGQYVATLKTVGAHYGFDYSVPYNHLSERAKKLALEGCGEEVFTVNWHYKRGAREGVHQMKTTWPGFLGLVETEYLRKHADARGEAMLSLMKNTPCSRCGGYRLNPDRLAYTIREMHIGQLAALPSDEALEWFGKDFAGCFTEEIERKAAQAFREPILIILKALIRAGLEYIGTDRTISTLSGGEYQRLQLAGLVRSPLCGVAYILDEPSFGLHHLNVRRVNELVAALNGHGNTIIMVENSPQMTSRAHHVITMGPGAGRGGGKVVTSGPAAEIFTAASPEEEKTSIPCRSGPGLIIGGAYANNLKQVNVEISSGIMTVITGVSGSGKTSLLDKVIRGSFARGGPAFCSDFSGGERFSGLVYVEQSLPLTAGNATAGSFLGLSEIIAGIFARDPVARNVKYRAAHFIRGTRESSCSACNGQGLIKVSMDFFSDVEMPCETCAGTGFRDEILGIRVDTNSVFDILQMPFSEMADFCMAHCADKIKPQLCLLTGLLAETGLQYLSAGRSIKTLSTGERQRLKLIRGLAGRNEGNTLILLDEPTGGLHRQDVSKLLRLFARLVSEGNTIICVTHEPVLIRAAGMVLELGPGGGKNGGLLVRNTGVGFTAAV